MKSLLKNAGELGVTDIVVPCVDQSSLKEKDDIDRFVDKLSQLIPDAEKEGVNFSLETDLDPQSFIELLDYFDSERVTVNYDIGNSAALGYDPVEELDAYGSKITDIHIKDRIYEGGPVVLGT
jgi:sugar phosphate isomerase/epimerase